MSPRIRMVGSVLATIGAVGLLVYVVARHTFLAEADPGDVSRHRLAIDSETGKVIKDFKVEEGRTYPWINPATGKATLYPAEVCMWTKDGKAKLEPTYVLLNELIGKAGPTICPDCGRTVVGHNPMPPANLIREAYELAKKK